MIDVLIFTVAILAVSNLILWRYVVTLCDNDRKIIEWLETTVRMMKGWR